MIPNKTDSQLDKWASEIKTWRRLDNRSIDEIKKVIEYIEWDHHNANSDFRWSVNIQSIFKLRKHFATLYAKMSMPSKDNVKKKKEDQKVNDIKNNKSIAEQIKKKVKHSGRSKYHLDDFSVSIASPAGKIIILGYSEYGFKDQLESILRQFEMI